MSDSAHYALAFLVYNIPLMLVIVASFVGLRRFRQLAPSLQALTLLACFDAAVELLAAALFRLGIPNLLLFPVSIVGEVGLLVLVFGRALQSRTFWRVALGATMLLAGYAVLDTLLAPGTTLFRPRLQVLGDLLFLSMATSYFYKLMNELQVERLAHDALFWVAVGSTITYTGDLFISLFSNYLHTHYSQQANQQVWHFHAFLVGLLYCTYLLALWMRPPKRSFLSY